MRRLFSLEKRLYFEPSSIVRPSALFIDNVTKEENEDVGTRYVYAVLSHACTQGQDSTGFS